MVALYIILGISSLLLIAFLITSYVLFYRVFRKKNKPLPTDENGYPIHQGKQYEPYREKVVSWVKEMRETPHTDVSITSFDGLTLRGKYYEYKNDAPIEILFHGYRSTSERDLSGAISRCFKMGHSALIVDHRACGESEGGVISFGILESRDCVDWINFTINNIKKDAEIIITGLSMGAATVMITAGKMLPPNVVGAIADCGYTSPRDIIKKVMHGMGLPEDILYPFAITGAAIFGHFKLEEASPIEAMKKATIPVLFFHGDNDNFVPLDMSLRNFEACVSPKKLVVVPGAEHGLAYPKDPETYIKEATEFLSPFLKKSIN